MEISPIPWLRGCPTRGRARPVLAPCISVTGRLPHARAGETPVGHYPDYIGVLPHTTDPIHGVDRDDPGHEKTGNVVPAGPLGVRSFERFSAAVANPLI